MNNQDALELIAAKISTCEKCSQLSCFRKENSFKTVPGDGNANAKILFLGEAPGLNEAEEGLPFIGPAGKLLDRVLSEIGLSRDQVFITNTIKCRPPQNRDPNSDEVANCKPYLKVQLQVIQPKLIICLGRVAAINLLGLPEFRTISSLRGKLFHCENIPVACTFHPSYALRNITAYEDILSDVVKALKNEYT